VRTLCAAVLAFLAAVGVSGCASTPQEIKETGTRTEHALKLSPAQAAGCLSRNADEFVDSLSSTVRALPAPNQHEVIVRISTGMGLRTLFVMEVVPEGTGSHMTMWAYQRLMQSREDEFRAVVVKGC